MGKKKTTQTQTNTFDYKAPPNTADIQSYRDTVNNAYTTPDPSIPYAYNQQREAINNRFGGVYGADYSPEVQDAMRYSGNEFLNQAQGQAVREDRFNRTNAQVGARAGLAGMTAPQLVQTGGTSVRTEPSNILGSILQAGASIGSAALG